MLETNRAQIWPNRSGIIIRRSGVRVPDSPPNAV